MFVLGLLLLLVLILYKAQVNTRVPRKVFQTHKSWAYIESNKALKDATDSWKKQGFEYHFYDDAQCDAFMKEYYQGTDIYKAYTSLKKPVMKADFWRYCVIYEFGGIYADADTVCLRDPSEYLLRVNTNLVVVPEPAFLFCQWVFAAPPKSPVLKTVINLMVYRVLYPQTTISEKDYGRNWVYYFTGPMLFTDGIQAYLNDYRKPENYVNPEVHVISEKNYFHKHVVRHLYMGYKGWKETLEN